MAKPTGRPFVREPFGNSAASDNTGRRLSAIDQIPIGAPYFRQIIAVLAELEAEGVPQTPDVITAAIAMGKRRWQRAVAEAKLVPRPRNVRCVDAPSGFVYYIVRGGAIKIGTTTDLRKRMTELMPDEVLATEPGSYTRESEMHRRFRHLRIGRTEYFERAPDLVEHIKMVREEHGAPDPKLPSLRRP